VGRAIRKQSSKQARAPLLPAVTPGPPLHVEESPVSKPLELVCLRIWSDKNQLGPQEAAGIEAAKGGSAFPRDQRSTPVFPLETEHLSVRASPGASIRFGPFLVPLDLACQARVASPPSQRARRQGIRRGQVGAVSFIQFFGSALQVTPHFHSLVPDGAFVQREGGVHFAPLPPPTQDEVERLLSILCRCEWTFAELPKRTFDLVIFEHESCASFSTSSALPPRGNHPF